VCVELYQWLIEFERIFILPLAPHWVRHSYLSKRLHTIPYTCGISTTRDEELEQSRRALPKNLIRPLPYRIAKASGSGDLLSRSPVHVGARDGVDYGGDASSERWQNPRSVPDVCGGSRARVYIGGVAEKP
jgi:hypothetical protein